MCGIAGEIRFNGSAVDTAALARMSDVLAPRGPDGSGVVTRGRIGLAHRRLKIIDVSEKAEQPMVDAELGLTAVFNGCIYNFLDLRCELEQCGFHFRSGTDTEVLVHGYRHWGIDALVGRLRGMFAFAVWDNPERRLTLVRDRLGVKPLLYAIRGERIAFASTVDALSRAGLAGEIDLKAVLEFLEFTWVTEERCIFDGVQKLPPATILEWQGGRASQRRLESAP